MALRSGYYGLKNATKKILEKLAVDTAGMKIIKSFGDGLSLSNAGKLSVTAATASKMGGFKVGNGLSMVDGVLSADNGFELLGDGSAEATTSDSSKSFNVELTGDLSDYSFLYIDFGDVLDADTDIYFRDGVIFKLVRSTDYRFRRICRLAIVNGFFQIKYVNDTHLNIEFNNNNVNFSAATTVSVNIYGIK